MKFDVVGMDCPCVDLAVNVDKFPEPNGSKKVQNCSWQGGGKVSSGLVAAARLGAKCAIIGNIGTDIYGSFCQADFTRHGIDITYLLKRKEKTTHFDIVLSNKETMGRSIMYYPGTSEPLTVEELPFEYLENTKYFFIARLDEVTVEAAKIAKAAGAKVIIDADSYFNNLESLFSIIDIFIGSEFIYKTMFSDMNIEKNCRFILEKGPEIVIFTLGEKGCAGVGREGYFRHPAYKVEVVDTVGAGDVYHGAFIAGLLKGWSAEKAAQFSSAVSAIKCTRIGGRAGIPDMKTTIQFMDTGEINYTEINQRTEFYRRGIEYV